MIWHPRHLPAVTLVAAALLTSLAIARLRRPIPFDPAHPAGDRATEVARRLDPNTATGAELAILPGIGPARAERIIAYREAAGPGTFQTFADLGKVRGVPRGVWDGCRPFLLLPGEARP